VKLQNFKLICYYCGSILEPHNVNEDCQQNQTAENHGNIGQTDKEPEESYHGSGKHFFAKPSSVVVKAAKEKELMRTAEKKKRRAIEDYKLVFEVLLEKVKRVGNERKVNLISIFQELDKSNTGVMSQLNFEGILSRNFGISEEEIEQLTKYLDPLQRDEVAYHEFFAMLNDPLYFDKISNQQ